MYFLLETDMQSSFIPENLKKTFRFEQTFYPFKNGAQHTGPRPEGLEV